MSIFAVLKFLNKMFPLYMIFLELCSSFNISIATAVCIIIWFVITYLLSKFFKTDGPSTESVFEMDRGFTTQENIVMTNFRKHSFLLKRISHQMTEDRRRLMQTLSPVQSALEEHFLEELESRRTNFFETISKSLEQKNAGQNQRVGEMMKNLDELQNDFLAIKNQLQQSPFSPFCLAFSKKTSPNNRDQGEEVYNSELLNDIVTASKECFSKLESEARMKGKEVVQSISRFLEQSQRDIRKELTIFSSSVEKQDNDRNEASNFSLISKVEKIERNLLNTFVFLNRQRFEMENLQKILKHFDGKFSYVATKFDAYWNQNLSAYDNAAQRLEVTEDLWTSVSDKVNGSFGNLINMLKNLTAMISDMQNTLMFRKNAGFSSSSLKLLAKNPEENSDTSEIPLTENIEHFNQKFEDMLQIIENTKDKLLSLTQASKSLQSSQDLIISITEGYNSLLSFFWPSFEKSRTVQAKLDREKQKTNYVGTMKAMNFMIRESKKIDDYQWEEVRDDLNKEFPNMDIGNIISLLKEIGKTSYNLVYCGSIKPEKESRKGYINDENFEESDQWEDISSESLLSDMPSICLVENSDDSESEAMESCLDIDNS